jgi:hypothetical protein
MGQPAGTRPAHGRHAACVPLSVHGNEWTPASCPSCMELPLIPGRSTDRDQLFRAVISYLLLGVTLQVQEHISIGMFVPFELAW